MAINIINPVKIKATIHGVPKSEILNRQSDGCGGMGASITNSPSGMPEGNPFKSEKQRKFLYSQKPSVAKKFALHSKKK